MVTTSVLLVLVVLAFVLCVLTAVTESKVPLWTSVFVLCVIELLRVVPLGHL